MTEILIAQRGTVAAYEIKTSNVILYSVECAGCGRQHDYETRELAVQVTERHSRVCWKARAALR